MGAADPQFGLADLGPADFYDADLARLRALGPAARRSRFAVLWSGGLPPYSLLAIGDSTVAIRDQLGSALTDACLIANVAELLEAIEPDAAA